MLIALAGILPIRLAAQTKVDDNQLPTAPVGLMGLQGIVNGARRFLALDSTLIIDPTVNKIRVNLAALLPPAPIPRAIQERYLSFVVLPAQTPILLPEVPTGTVKVFRNGLLLDPTDPLDYTFAANAVTPGSTWVVGDKIQILYVF